MINYHIEQASASDFLNVAALDRIAWPDRPDTFIPDGEHIWRIWCDHGTLLVARSVNEPPLPDSVDVVGALVMFPTAQQETVLHKIMVHPSCRGQGIGTALMEAALERADTPVLLTVDPQNEAAVQLYRNFGFEVRQKIDGYYRPHEDRYIMVHPGSTTH